MFTSDQEAIARIRAGDRDAFSALYRAHYVAMWRLVMRIVSDGAAADDIVQDVFLSIWQNRAEWSPRTGILEYVLRAARNNALQSLAHNAVVNRTAHFVRDEPGTGVTRASRPDVVVEHADLESAIDFAIAQLPERQRAAFTLRWDQDLSAASIGRVLGISDVAAGKLITKAQATLRAALERFRR